MEIDFTEQIRQLEADKKAGYPPNCNKGYEEKDGKCVPIKKDKDPAEGKKPYSDPEAEQNKKA